MNDRVAGTVTSACKWTAHSLRVRGGDAPEIERSRLREARVKKKGWGTCAETLAVSWMLNRDTPTPSPKYDAMRTLPLTSKSVPFLKR